MSWCGQMSQWEENRRERGHVKPRLLVASCLCFISIKTTESYILKTGLPVSLTHGVFTLDFDLEYNTRACQSPLTLHQFPIPVTLHPLDGLTMWGSSIPSNTAPVEFTLNDSGLIGKEGLSVRNQRDVCINKWFQHKTALEMCVGNIGNREQWSTNRLEDRRNFTAEVTSNVRSWDGAVPGPCDL